MNNEFSNLNPERKSLADIRKEAYEQGFADGINEAQKKCETKKERD